MKIIKRTDKDENEESETRIELQIPITISLSGERGFDRVRGNRHQ